MHEYALKCVWEKTTPLSGKNNTYPDKMLKPHEHLSALISYSPNEVSTVDVKTHHKFLLLAAQNMHLDANGLRRHA